MAKEDLSKYHLFPSNKKEILGSLGKEKLIRVLEEMLLIRNFEIRAESAYLQGKVGGFFHAYVGQEAIQTAAVTVMGRQQWWTTSYRCHALALLLGATPNELMAELYGKVTGNARGRGGSMHFYTDRLLGGFGIVGGQIPVATGAAFTAKYLKKKEISICFLGDGAVAQGAFHESLNLAALWNLPCLYVIENNKWGMGTAVERAISVEPIAEKKAESFGMKGYTVDGMDFFACYAFFQHIFKEIQATGAPVLVEMITERFKGHSISDPGLYRSKECLAEAVEKDPIQILLKEMIAAGMITTEEYEALDRKQKEVVIASMKYAEESPSPSPITLEEDVYAP